MKFKQILKPLSKSVALTLAPAAVAVAGKSQLGVDHLSMDEFPTQNVTVCAAENAETTGGILPDQLIVAVDPFEAAAIKLSFSVGDLISTSLPKDHVLALGVSRIKTLSPGISTPHSAIDLGLDLSDLEILGLYSIPQARQQEQQMTRFGQGVSSGRMKFSFEVNLHTDKIADLIRTGRNEIFVQAILVAKDEFAAGNFQNAILSEVDRLEFSKNSCVEDALISIVVDDEEGTTTTIADENGQVMTKTSKTAFGNEGELIVPTAPTPKPIFGL